ncbi:MAG: HEAT repeat domain-containing protein [Armatimonadota bacterium]
MGVRSKALLQVVLFAVLCAPLAGQPTNDQERARQLIARVLEGDATAAAALEGLGGFAAREIQRALPNAPSAARATLIRVLARLGETGTLETVLARLASDESPEVRRAAALALLPHGGYQSVRALAGALGDPDPEVASVALEVLVGMLHTERGEAAAQFFRSHPVFAETMLAVFRMGRETARRNAAIALSGAPLFEDAYAELARSYPRDVAMILRQSGHKSDRVINALAYAHFVDNETRIEIIRMAAEHGGDRARAYVEVFLDARENDLKAAALSAAVQLGSEKGIAIAIRDVTDYSSPPSGVAAVRALESVGSPEARDALLKVLREERWRNWRTEEQRALVLAVIRLMRGTEPLAPEVAEQIREVLRSSPLLLLGLFESLPEEVASPLVPELEQIAFSGYPPPTHAIRILLERRHPRAIEFALDVAKGVPWPKTVGEAGGPMRRMELPTEWLKAIVETGDRRFIEPLQWIYLGETGSRSAAVRNALLEFGTPEVLRFLMNQMRPRYEEEVPFTPERLDLFVETIYHSPSADAQLAATIALARQRHYPIGEPTTSLLALLRAFVDLMEHADVRIRRIAASQLVFGASFLAFTRGHEVPSIVRDVAAVAERAVREDPDATVKADALRALDRLWRAGMYEGERLARLALPLMWRTEPDVRRAAINSVVETAPIEAWDELLLLRRNASSDTRHAILMAIEYGLLDGEVVDKLLRQPDLELRWAAARRLMGDRPRLERLVVSALEGDPTERLTALRFLAQWAFASGWSPEFVRRVRGVMLSGTDEERALAERFLRETDAEFALAYFVRELKSHNPMNRRGVVQWFGHRWRMPAAVGYLAPLFDGWDFELQVAAVDLLQRIGSPEALELLSRLQDHQDPAVAHAARTAIGEASTAPGA